MFPLMISTPLTEAISLFVYPESTTISISVKRSRCKSYIYIFAYLNEIDGGPQVSNSVMVILK